jgi:hypothetical protein
MNALQKLFKITVDRWMISLAPRILLGAWANAQSSVVCWATPPSKESSEIF